MLLQIVNSAERYRITKIILIWALLYSKRLISIIQILQKFVGQICQKFGFVTKNFVQRKFFQTNFFPTLLYKRQTELGQIDKNSGNFFPPTKVFVQSIYVQSMVIEFKSLRIKSCLYLKAAIMLSSGETVNGMTGHLLYGLYL